jgi:hypothetical protein
MIPPVDGKELKKPMGSPRRIIKKSYRTKEAFVLYVSGILNRLNPEDTLQLTIATQPEKFEVSFVSTAITNS